jgi:hypothetical protein
VDRSDLAAVQKGDELIRHGRFVKASRTPLISGVLALLIERVSWEESGFRSTDTPRLFSVRKMRPIFSTRFPPFQLDKPFPARPSFLSQGI